MNIYRKFFILVSCCSLVLYYQSPQAASEPEPGDQSQLETLLSMRLEELVELEVTVATDPETEPAQHSGRLSHGGPRGVRQLAVSVLIIVAALLSAG